MIVSKGKNEVGQNDPKPVSTEYKPRVPYPNATRKDRSDEKFGKLTLRVEDEPITLQARNSSNTSKIEGGCINHSTSNDHVVKPSMQETIAKNIYESCSNNNKGPIYEERRLQIEELDEWQTQKSRTPDRSKPSQDELNTSPNQLKVGDKVLLDVADPRITTFETNEEIPLTVLSIFPYGTIETSSRLHSQAHGRALFHMKTGQDFFPNTGYDKLPCPCDMAVGETGKTTWGCDTLVL
ncbi:hypothetical protein GOBAR_AA25417 [Gossypium barbadense]|uniref:Uncharacterized protein n=1 Tax=Gossypium barbadense TaxID=3634 RepID=A0A2P5WW00_GOSBA|nr:hypothetical protein GOBAR_AA25417 [Gossypium barbadense]